MLQYQRNARAYNGVNVMSKEIVYPRLIKNYIKSAMEELPAIAVEGLKGVGKTELCRKLANTTFELDRDADFTLMENSIDTVPEMPPPVLIDEWQRLPKTWDYVRRAVDSGAKAGRFLITGSIANTNTDIHSGAGRIAKYRMYPLSLEERMIENPSVSLGDIFSAKPFSAAVKGKTKVGFNEYISEICKSGLPSIRKFSLEHRKDLMESYISNLLSHEFKQQGVSVRQPLTLKRWLMSYAAAIGTDAGYNEILDASTAGEGNKPSAKTTISYREALGNLWLLDELNTWIDGEKYFSGLKRSPKHYLADPAIAVYLLGLDEDSLISPELLSDPAISRMDEKYGNIYGRLFESLMQLCLRTYAQVNSADVSYLKTRRGDHEVDFILEKGRSIVAVEVKFSPTVDDQDVKHLSWLRNKVGGRLKDMVLVNTGNLAYRRDDGVAVIPAALLGA